MTLKTFTSNDPAQGPRVPLSKKCSKKLRTNSLKPISRPPVLKQSYNLGSGQGEDNPNVYKNQAVNFYVDAPTARWEGDLMIGHVEMESYPTQMTIQYGNGDEGSFYTMGKPVSRHVVKSHARPRPVMSISVQVISMPTQQCLTLAVSA